MTKFEEFQKATDQTANLYRQLLLLKQMRTVFENNLDSSRIDAQIAQMESMLGSISNEIVNQVNLNQAEIIADLVQKGLIPPKVIKSQKQENEVRRNLNNKMNSLNWPKPPRKTDTSLAFFRSSPWGNWTLSDYYRWVVETKIPIHSYQLTSNKKVLDSKGNVIQRTVENERHAIEQYFSRLPKQYVEYIRQVSEMKPMMKMDADCRVAVNVPCYNEGRNVKKFLEVYVTQRSDLFSPLDPKQYEFNIILNRRQGTPEDEEAIQSILDFQKHNKHIHVNWMSVEFEDEYSFGSRSVGLARRVITDVTLYRSYSRTNQVKPLYIESEDCDHSRVDRDLLAKVIKIFDEHPEYDVVYGVAERDPSVAKQNDLVFLKLRFEQILELLRQKSQFKMKEPATQEIKSVEHNVYHGDGYLDEWWRFTWNRIKTLGWNCAFSAEIYALIDGYDGFKKVQEDLDIGKRISIVRGRVLPDNRIIPFIGSHGRHNARINSSARRYLNYFLVKKLQASRNKSVTFDIYSGFEDSTVDKQVKSLDEKEVLNELESFSKISESNKQWFEEELSFELKQIVFAEGEQNKELKVSLYIFQRVLFFLGFKKNDYEIMKVALVEDPSDIGYRVSIKNIRNFQMHMQKYKRFNMDVRREQLVEKKLETAIKKFNTDDSANLYWKRKEAHANLKEIIQELESVSGFSERYDELGHLLKTLKGYSTMLYQNGSTVRAMMSYLKSIDALLSSGKSDSTSFINALKSAKVKVLEYQRVIEETRSAVEVH